MAFSLSDAFLKWPWEIAIIVIIGSHLTFFCEEKEVLAWH